LLIIERRDFRFFLLDVPEAGLKLIETLGAELQLADTQCEEMASVPLPGRMARVLLDFADESARSERGIDLKQFERLRVQRSTHDVRGRGQAIYRDPYRPQSHIQGKAHADPGIT
jgi:hypothetical protein